MIFQLLIHRPDVNPSSSSGQASGLIAEAPLGLASKGASASFGYEPVGFTHRRFPLTVIHTSNPFVISGKIARSDFGDGFKEQNADFADWAGLRRF
ncbi:MAG: hypothetical protein HQ525_02100 [Anaerolineae bacterium]|nr:hypothetical protein [Anaerolineae bacterium]